MRKRRIPIPADVSARVLFLADRTCCVCREAGKKVQIHHLDDDPANNDAGNLAVLCTECHDDTMLRGGFGRKLDSDQVRLYRDDWLRLVAERRATAEAQEEMSGDPSERLRLATSMAEAYRENEEYELLAIHYDQIGNIELRDKYTELVLADEPADSTIVFLRGLQGRPDLIPADVIEREEAAYTERGDILQRARFYDTLRRHRDATQDYLTGIGEALSEERFFSAAYYLKELCRSGLLKELFVLALADAKERDELWWQIRALQELRCWDELHELILANAEVIEESQDGMQLILLADARGDEEEAIRLRVEEARERRVYPGAGGGGVYRQRAAAGDEQTDGREEEPDA